MHFVGTYHISHGGNSRDVISFTLTAAALRYAMSSSLFSSMKALIPLKYYQQAVVLQVIAEFRNMLGHGLEVLYVARISVYKFFPSTYMKVNSAFRQNNFPVVMPIINDKIIHAIFVAQKI